MTSINSVAAGTLIGRSDAGAQRPAAPLAPAGGTPGAAGGPDAREAATSERLKAAVAQANEQLSQSNRELAFVFDDKLGRMLVKIVDKSTNTVIRQVPSEDMLAAARALTGTQTRGALLNGKA